jgi:hypothetical protein
MRLAAVYASQSVSLHSVARRRLTHLQQPRHLPLHIQDALALHLRGVRRQHGRDEHGAGSEPSDDLVRGHARGGKMGHRRVDGAAQRRRVGRRVLRGFRVSRHLPDLADKLHVLRDVQKLRGSGFGHGTRRVYVVSVNRTPILPVALSKMNHEQIRTWEK